MNKKDYTIKELADYCGISKTSINRIIKELEIEPTLAGNKNIIKNEDADRIVLFCRGFGLNSTENETNQTNTETYQGKSIQNETETSKNNSKTTEILENEKNHSDILINILMEQIKEKDKQIANLQEDNKLLIQAQAYTLKRIEDLEKPQQIEAKEEEKTEQPQEPARKKSWFPWKK